MIMNPYQHRSSFRLLSSPPILAVVLGLIASFAGAAPGAKVDLVRDGEAQAVIVASAELSPSERTAVAELQKYIKQMSGAGIPVRGPNDPVESGMVRLVLGNKTVRALYPDVSLDNLGTDGFILKSVGDALLVAGGERRGTMYATFELLERLGVRWWAVGATDVPKKPTITVASMNVRQIPSIEYRDMLYGTRYVSEEDNKPWWFSHNKLNGFNYSENPESRGGRVEFAGNLVHSHASLMKPVGNLDGSFAKHPEYWSQIDGKHNPHQVCPSRPEVFEIMLANVRKQLAEHPQYEFVVVGQEDNNSYCRCETCSALAAAEESPAAPGLQLANRIAEVLEKEFPGKWVMTPAYTWSRKAPKTLVPRSNVGIVLCSIECDFNRPLADATTAANKAFVEDIVAWGKIAPKLYIWDYTTDFNHYLLPFPNLDALVPNIRFLAENEAKGILAQGSHSTAGAEFEALRMWVMAKAMWQPEADGKALIKEFVDGYYGAAGTAIEKYIDIIHGPGRAHPNMSATCYALLDAAWLAPEVIADAEAVLQEAERAVAGNPALLARAQHAHLPIWYVLLKRGTQSKTWAAASAKVGGLSIESVAEKFCLAVNTQGIGGIAEGEGIKPFVAWARDYAKQAAVGPPLPPELRAADPKTYRLIQACQMDARARWWTSHPGASDGWVCEIPTVAWTVIHQFSPQEDLVPGKTYKLFVRVKASEAAQEGNALLCGMHEKDSKSNITKRIPAAELADGQFHSVEVGEFLAGKTNGRFWAALPRETSPKVFLDCIWLQAVEPSAAK